MKIFLNKKQIDELTGHSWFKWIRTYRYSLLFMALLSQFIFMPFLEEWSLVFVPLLFFLVVITVLLTLDLRKTLFVPLFSLGLFATFLHMLGRALHVTAVDETYLVMFGLGLEALFFALVVWVLILKVFSETKVTSETIKGGISIYFLLGLLWAYLYTLILLVQPDAISFSVSPPVLSQINYFSFTTLTTLGYGDITPISWIARNLTILEATIGQIFLTVFIARLVGLHLVQRSRPVSAAEEDT